MLERTAPIFGSPVLPLRFWAKVDQSPDGCWLWVAARSGSGGYATYTVNGKTERAHRVAYEALAGEIPADLVLDHLCRVRHCVNPAHLEPVTNRVNLLRGETLAAKQASQSQCLRGHAYTAASLIVSRDGKRTCRTCRNAQRRGRRLAAKAA